MTGISGILLETRLRKVVLTFFVCKKLKERSLIYSLFIILPLKDLIDLISAPRLGLLGEFLSAGPPTISVVALLKSTLLLGV
jgi:hypothetical protein